MSLFTLLEHHPFEILSSQTGHCDENYEGSQPWQANDDGGTNSEQGHQPGGQGQTYN